ncbi:MAG: DUF3307 domain-containing protein [Hyphomicrobium sp.]
MLAGSEIAGAHAALAAVAYLMVKHAAADFFLQSERQREEKGVYGKPGGVLHSLTHIALTLPVFLLVPTVGVGVVAALLAAEFALHYHIDWTKEQVVRRNGWTSHDTRFWWAVGFDQMLHGLTYVGLLWVVFAA